MNPVVVQRLNFVTWSPVRQCWTFCHWLFFLLPAVPYRGRPSQSSDSISHFPAPSAFSSLTLTHFLSSFNTFTSPADDWRWRCTNHFPQNVTEKSEMINSEHKQGIFFYQQQQEPQNSNVGFPRKGSTRPLSCWLMRLVSWSSDALSSASEPLVSWHTSVEAERQKKEKSNQLTKEWCHFQWLLKVTGTTGLQGRSHRPTTVIKGIMSCECWSQWKTNSLSSLLRKRKKNTHLSYFSNIIHKNTDFQT